MEGNFKIIILVIFIAAALIGILVFAGVIPIGKNNGSGSLGTVVLWGTASNEAVSPIIEDFNRVNTTFTLKYVQKFPETFDHDLLEALASGTGPDLFFLTDDFGIREFFFIKTSFF